MGVVMITGCKCERCRYKSVPRDKTQEPVCVTNAVVHIGIGQRSVTIMGG